MQGGHLAQPHMCTQDRDDEQGGHVGKQEDQQSPVSQVGLSSCPMASTVAYPGHGPPHGDAGWLDDGLDEEIYEEEENSPSQHWGRRQGSSSCHQLQVRNMDLK